MRPQVLTHKIEEQHIHLETQADTSEVYKSCWRPISESGPLVLFCSVRINRKHSHFLVLIVLVLSDMFILWQASPQYSTVGRITSNTHAYLALFDDPLDSI